MTTMTYDGLNRVTAKTYSDGGITPNVSYCYDGQTWNGTQCTGTPAPPFLGRLREEVSSASSTKFTNYDLLGRVTASSQTTGGTPYTFAYTYKPNGLWQITYPSQRVVTYTYTGAGRVATVSGQMTGNNTTYANLSAPNSYTPHGAIASMILTNGLLTDATTYNPRLQPTQIQASGLLTIGYDYGTSQNNGNVQSQTIIRGSQTWTQTYTNCYDAVNRLACASESGAGSWSQTYGYDNFGNRWLASSSSTLPSLTLQVPTGSNWFVNNQIKTSPSGAWTYDNAGNLKGMAGMPDWHFDYDAENRQTSVATDPDSPSTTYTYDGDGRRVTKTWSGQTTTFVYDATGNLAAEYGGSPGGTGTQYLTTDHLGSTRLVTDSNGAVVTCYDYLPFGEEIGNGTAGRTAPCFGGGFYPVAGGATNREFTSKERDAETGLDYFGARYLSAAQGRFTSPDLPVDQHPQDPQSWNLYSYVRNNPLSLTDPTGNYACGTYTTESQCTAFGNMLAQTQSTLDKARQAGTIDSDQYKSASAAAAAYGRLNDGNGVTVNVGATGGFPGNTIAEGGGEKTAANPTGQDIQVTLNGKLFDQAMSSSSGSSTAMLGVIAHEGSHVRDAEAWATAGFTPGANPANLRTEFAAYGVTITMAQTQGATILSGTKPGGNTSIVFWNSQRPADNQAIRTNMIKAFYPAWAVKAFGENTKGSGWGTK